MSHKQQQFNSNILQRFFWSCAGADSELLTREDCQTDRKKQEAIGRMVLLTASTSALSGFYAFNIAFASLPIAVALGGFWGLMIFNLDRFFILSAKKKKNNFFGQLKVLAPRFALAGVLAVGISKPIELKMFESNIKEEILKAEKATLLKDIQTIQTKIENLRKESDEKEEEFKEYANSKVPGKEAQQGRILEEKKKIQDIIQRYEARLQDKESHFDNPQLQHIGLSKQLETIEKLADKDPTIGKINLFITLLFVMIELSPVVGKLMSEYGSYDATKEGLEEKAIYYHIQKLADKRKDIDEQIDIQRKIRGAVRADVRQRLEEFLTHQITVVLEETTQSDELAKIRQKIIKVIADNLEEGMMQQFSQIKMTGVEIEQELQEIQNNILKQKLGDKVSHAITKAKMGRLFEEELEELKDIANPNENN